MSGKKPINRTLINGSVNTSFIRGMDLGAGGNFPLCCPFKKWLQKLLLLFERKIKSFSSTFSRGFYGSKAKAVLS
jgi:hypothetical protein